MANSKKISPAFENPPVVETILGVQFAQLINCTSGHFGWFWKEYLGSEWPKAADAAFLPDQFEKFGEQISWLAPGLRFAPIPVPPPRLQISNAAEDRMIQIQNSRFIYNWRKQKNGYPSYSKCRSEFDVLYAGFSKFVGDAGLGQLTLNQWEVSYIDHVPKGQLWQFPSDWHRVIPGLLGANRPVSGTRFENVGEWHYEIEPERGRLHIAIQHGRLGTTSETEVLALQWTARGPILDKPGWDLDAGLTLGHNIITRAFLEMTSPEAQRAWGRRE